MVRSLAFATVLAGALAGCGGPSATPSQDAGAAPKTPITDSAAANDLAVSVEAAAYDVFLATGTGDAGASTSTDARTAAPAVAVRDAGSQAGFTFQNNGSFTVAIESLTWADGSRRFPRTTGTVQGTYAGAWTASQPLGSGGVGTWTLALTNTTALTYDDPAKGLTVAIPAGGWNLSSQVDVSGLKTDDLHWSLEVGSHLGIAAAQPVQATITRGGASLGCTHWGHRDGAWTLSRDGSAYAFTHDVTAWWRWDYATTAGVPLTSVVWDRTGLDAITIRVGDAVYGPYTRWDLLLRWGCTAD
jgi:hypothetical protein